MSEFESSDDEERQAQLATQPLIIDRLDFTHGLFDNLGSVYISGLPGCWFRETRQNLHRDMVRLVELGVKDAIVLLTKAELRQYRVPSLLSVYEQHGICPHYHPLQDGSAPTLNQAMAVLSKTMDLVRANRSVLLHCMCGYGRAGVMGACLLQWLEDSMTPEQSVGRLRQLRGPRAIQTVPQYNFVMEFREMLSYERERSVSR